MKALVTGGAGFIGSNLVDALLERGAEVVVVDNLSTGRRENLDGALAGDAKLVELDITDGEALAALVTSESPDTVFHFAAQIDVRKSLADPAFDASINVGGTANLLEAARAAGVRRFVFASTGGAIYGEGVDKQLPLKEDAPIEPFSAYGQSKYAGEGYLALYERLYGLSTVSMRFGNVYGPRQDPHGEAGVIAIFSGKLRAGEQPTVYGTGRQTRDYIYVGDVVSGLIAAGDSDVAGSINLGTEEETTVLQIVEKLGALSEGSGFEAQMAEARLGEIDRSCLAVGKARELLGWQAQVGIDEGLRLTYEASAP